MTGLRSRCVCHFGLTAITILGLACSATDESASDGSRPSLTEYNDAFEDFKDCVVESGGKVERLETDPQTGLISYRAQPPATGDAALDDCYNSTFLEVELAFTRSVLPADGMLPSEDREFFANTILPCLEANDVDAVMPDTFGAEYQALAEQFNDLAARGLCPGVTATASETEVLD